MANVTLGVDLGTTGVKVVAVDVDRGHVVAQAAGEYPSLQPVPAAHEQHPATWWARTQAAIREVTRALEDAHIAAVGLSGQMHALLLVDTEGRPVAPAMTWADRRVASDTARLAADPRFRELTGNTPVDAFTAPKLAWLARTDPRLLARASRLVLAKDYIRFQLTGSWATDTTDAMGTLLYDLHRGRWSPELWEAAGATAELAPAVLAAGDVAGVITAHAARCTGVPEGTPVATGSGDVPAAVLGSGVTRSGQVSLNVGTAAQVMKLTDEADPGAGFLFGAAYGDQPYLVMASLYAAGASLRWAGRVFLDSHEDINDMAADAPPGAQGLTYLPFMFGATVPRKDDGAAGAFLGQRDVHDRTDLVRAVLEGVAYGCADAVRAVMHESAPEELRIVGGVTGSPVWREAFASVVEAPVLLVPEGGSPRGAALLGLSAVGVRLEESPLLTGRTVPMEDVAEGRRRGYREAYDRYRSAAGHQLSGAQHEEPHAEAFSVAPRQGARGGVL